MLDTHKGRVEPLEITPGFGSIEFKEFINKIYVLGASDIKLQSNDFVWADLNRIWQPVSNRRLESQEVESALSILLDQSALGLVSAGQPVDDRVDLYRSADEVNEFRLNATGCMVAGARDGMSITLRAIPKKIPSLKTLGIEREIVENFFPRYGLILVVGTTGSGKTTLMSSSLSERLVERRHDPVAIGTYEDPVEYGLAGMAEGYMPEPTQMAIGQGSHVKSFSMIGANAMRRRFDVIVAGEIRDLESARMGGELARTGHSVLATLHVDTPAEAFDRIIKFYPPTQQEGEAFGLLSQIRMIVAQKLSRTTDGGKMAFRSWLVLDRTIKATLAGAPVAHWARIVTEEVKKRGADFETSAYAAFAAKRITGEAFCEIAGMTVSEAREYVSSRGGDVSTLG